MQAKLNEFVAGARDTPGAGAFFIDFDGTLSKIVADPARATPVPGASQVLVTLAASYRTVALVTGRRASWLADVVDASGVRYLGLYGAEEMIDGRTVQPVEADRYRSSASRLARDAEALITTQGLAGCEVEFKDLAVSIHFRLAPDSRERLTTWAMEAAPHRGFVATLGRMVVELRPKDVSKANALKKIAGEQKVEWVVVAGDDQTDVEMMQAARQLFGDRSLCIGIASLEEPTEMAAVADFRVDGPEDFVETLELFVIR